MIRTFNPPDVAPPPPSYSHGAAAGPDLRWLHLAGQVGIAPDGTIRDGFAAQLEQCFANVFAVLAADGMTKADIVKLVVFVTPHGPDVIAEYRDVRNRMMEGHTPPATYLGVTSLAHTGFLVEVEAIAAAPA
jgi:enamine deaminase RidA (YjgF/YER057c/UK114 family)